MATEWEPPNALNPTHWVVKASTLEEKENFRKQERMRYALPHKPFTYCMHGYYSIVGRVKGIYHHNAGSEPPKGRVHSLLIPNRPNFITMTVLVTDAVARLPNGKGTRADICTLLQDSQFIQEGVNKDSLSSSVSKALDKIQDDDDPPVKYYPKRREWLYLHRARTESVFGK